MQIYFSLLSSLISGTVLWLLAFKLERLMQDRLGSDPIFKMNWTEIGKFFSPRDFWRMKVPFWRNFLPAMPFFLVACVGFAPLILFKGYIKDLRAFTNVWTIGFYFAGWVLAGIIWRKFIP
jgi:hypothetical protein